VSIGDISGEHPMLLRTSSLSFAYSDAPVIRDVSFDLAAGEVVALLGPNGSGKSTLIKLLLGHLRGRGGIEWNGRVIEGMSRRELSRLVAYLPQTPTLDPDQTVADVLRLGRLPYWGAFGLESPRDAAVVARVAEALELTDLLRRRVDEISGGQRQRAFIGRCLAQEPAALLLDEPATFLDLRHQLDLHRLLRRLAREQDLAVLMAVHDLNLAATHADRLILLKDGFKVAEGPPGDVLREDLLREVYGVTMRRVEVDGRVALVASD
jgi:iron complex transport system ATP-binding protein